MAGTKTFTMIKPDAFAAGNSGAILTMIEAAGFKIVAMKLTTLTSALASKFYGVHSERSFYPSLVEFMSSGPLVAIVLEKEDAVLAYRNLIGATNPEQAAAGTIRKQFAQDLQRNAVHGSDSDENALAEAHFFFSEFEMI
jgi:nucleoside-diphosphate kinase